MNKGLVSAVIADAGRTQIAPGRCPFLSIHYVYRDRTVGR